MVNQSRQSEVLIYLSEVGRKPLHYSDHFINIREKEDIKVKEGLLH